MNALVVLIPAEPGEFPDNRSHTICYFVARLPWNSDLEVACMFPKRYPIFHKKLWEQKAKYEYPNAKEYLPLETETSKLE